MPDAFTPVALGIKPPDPMAGINAYSGILGLQQQQQQLQTGQYQQQTAQANASQDQQRNRELQAVSGLMRNVHGGGYRKDDGTFDEQKFADDVQAVAPVYGQQVATSARSQANEIVANQSAKQKLTEESRQDLGDVLNSLSTNPETRRGDVVTAVTKYIQDHKDDPNAIRVATAQLALLPPDDNSPNFRTTLSNFAGTLTGKPQSAPTTIDTGTQIQPGSVLNATGAVTPAGGAFNKQNVVTTPAGPLAVATPARGTIAPLTTPGAPPAPRQELNTTRVQQQTNESTAQGIVSRVQQAQAAANNSIQAQDALSRARTLLDNPSIDTGKGFDSKRTLSNAMAAAGIDTQGATDANTLVKNLARYEAARATQAGLGGTDAARELAHNGSPNTNVDQRALRGMVTQSLATEKALAAYARIQAKTGDAGAQQRNESDFRNIPHLIEGYEYGLARTPQEAEEFLKRHNLDAKQMAQIRAQIREFESR